MVKFSTAATLLRRIPERYVVPKIGSCVVLGSEKALYPAHPVSAKPTPKGSEFSASLIRVCLRQRAYCVRSQTHSWPVTVISQTIRLRE